MAWVNRTPRGELFGDPGNVGVGPGSYNPDAHSIKREGVNYAPFVSTSHRAVLDIAPPNSGVPAPGQYDPKPITKYTGGALAQPFVSQTPRFTFTTNDTPGPGTYGTVTSAINVNKSKSLPRKTTQNAVEFIRVPTVPSIPSHRFQYGFHEEGGLLVAQGPIDEPQPSGPYVPPSSVSNAKGVPFAKSAGPRDVFGAVLEKKRIKPRTAPSIPKTLSVRTVDPAPEAVIPGPGQYNVEDYHSIGGLNSHVAGNKVVGSGGAAYLRYKPSAVFLSKPARDPANPDQPLRTAASIPYKTNNALGDDAPRQLEPFTPPSAFDKAAQPLPPSKQCFLSRAPRKTGLAPENYTPGAGSYDVSAAISFPLKDAPATLSGTAAPTAAQSRAFRSSVPRFQEKEESVTPGPGAYGVPEERPAAKKYSRNATFGSTSARFAQPSAPTGADNPLLGPGSYRPERTTDIGRLAEKSEPTGVAFSTRTTRLAYHGSESPRRHVISTIDTNAAYRIPGYGYFGTRMPGTTARQDAENAPAVGAYDMDREGRKRAELKQQQGVQHFLSRSQRFENNEQIKNALLTSHLAPGRYSPQHNTVQKANPTISSSFKSSSSRFGTQDTYSTLQADTPGPGAYNTSPPPLIQKSYNITIK